MICRDQLDRLGRSLAAVAALLRIAEISTNLNELQRTEW
jgi:hypothetical protein